MALLGPACSHPAYSQITVATQNYDNGRSGADVAETALTPANVNVNSFGKLFTISGLDANVGGQPLYVPSVVIGGASRDVLYVSQVNDSDNSPCGLSAFDADTGAALWHTGLPASAKYTTATPVIDTAAGILYLITKTGTDATGATFLHAVSIQTGAEEPGRPIQVQASVAGTGDGTVNGVVSFDGPSTGTSRFHANDRPALLLLNGTVYAAFAHNTDSFPYHGWILAYKYNGAGFTQTAKFCTTPNGSDGGIWMSGKWQFPVVANGKVYVPTGSSSLVVYGLLPTTVSGAVSLQGVAAGRLAQPLTFTLTPTGQTGGGVVTVNATPAAADGSFTLGGVPAGTYTLGVKGAKWLQRDVTLDTTGGPVSGLSVSLLGGDLTDDNRVTIQDYNLFSAAYGTNPASNPLADLNCDGKVSIQDYNIFSSNYGKRGDTTPTFP